MKRLIAVLFLVFASQIFCSYSYSKKCEKCIEYAKKQKLAYPSIGIAHRDFETPIVHKNGKAYATYKCEYGHVYLVDLSK